MDNTDKSINKSNDRTSCFSTSSLTRKDVYTMIQDLEDEINEDERKLEKQKQRLILLKQTLSLFR